MIPLILEYYEENFDRLVKKISYRVGGHHNGEDVVQEAFARAIKYKHTFRAVPEEFERWFTTILNNATRDFKKEDRRGGMTSDAYESEELDLDMNRERLAREVRQEMTKLKPDHATILDMFYSGHTAKEITEVVDTSVPNIRKIVYRFKESMKEKYGADMRG